MKFSESIENIAKAIIEIQKELKPLEKNASNPFTDSKYTPLDKIVEEIFNLAPNHGIAFTQHPISNLEDETIIGIETLLMHSSGEFILYEPFYLKVVDNKKMSSAQEGGSTITYAKRYALAAIFGIVSDEDKDGNGKPDKKQNDYKASEKQLAFFNKLVNEYSTIKKADSEEVKLFALKTNKIEKFEGITGKDVSKLIKYMQEQIQKA